MTVAVAPLSTQPAALLAQLPDGMALVRFPIPSLGIVANIADTETMWTAGDRVPHDASKFLGTRYVRGMANAPEPIVRMPLRVRFHECDPQGVVFNAHYLAYADMASFECLKALFGSHAKLVERGIDLVVAESNVRYRAACYFDDELVVATYAQQVGSTSLVLRFEIERGTELVAEVTNRYVWVSTETMRPARPPDEVREAFARLRAVRRS